MSHRTKINKLFDGVPPYTPEQMPKFDKPPLPPELITVTGTGNPKYDKIISDVLNRNPKLRKAAERIARKHVKASVDRILNGKVVVRAYGNLSKNEGFRVAGVGNPNVATDETKNVE